MRSWRRGTKEMDMVLGPFADAKLATMSSDELAHYQQLLHENDQDLYQWVSGQSEAPANFKSLISEITQFTTDAKRSV